MRIAMFVKNSFEYDARVTKEARTLVKNGHEVTVVAILVPRVTPETETTADGIRVIRVSRAGMGLPTVGRLAKRFAVFIEARRARLVGAPVDVERARALGDWTEPATATPGDAAGDVLLPEVANRKRNFLMRVWGRGSTLVLRLIARTGRSTFIVAKRLLSGQGSKLKNRAIDQRMARVGLGLGADVFHSHDLNTLRIGALCKRRTGSLLVYDSHELQTERSRMGSRERARAVTEEGRLMSDADALIMASPPWIDWNRRLYGSLPDPTVALLNTPHLITVEPLSLHDELDLPTHARIVVYQGSIQEHRGIEPAIDAVATLDNVVLVVIGYGYHRPTLEASVAARGLGDKVALLRPHPQRHPPPIYGLSRHRTVQHRRDLGQLRHLAAEQTLRIHDGRGARNRLGQPGDRPCDPRIRYRFDVCSRRPCCARRGRNPNPRRPYAVYIEHGRSPPPLQLVGGGEKTTHRVPGI